MIQIKLIAVAMPSLAEPQGHSIITFSLMAYFSILFLVLRTLQYNKDRIKD
jgi:hypothetical protein